MKTFKLLFHSLVLMANVIVVLLFIIAAYSDRVSPEKSAFLSYMGLGFPVLCVINICFVIYWICVQEWKFMLLGIASFIICLGPMTTYFPIHGKTNPVPGGALKVLTYNVMAFGYKNHTKDNPNRIVQYIADSKADIVCLQEYNLSPSDLYLTSKKLLAALSMYPYHKVVDLPSGSAVAVFSKYPITSSRRIKYESVANGSAIFSIDIKGKKLTLINNHLESLKLTSEDRTKYAEFIKGLSADKFDGLKGTIQRKIGPAFRIRAKQAEVIAREIKDAKGDYILVCGDFNDTPISYAHRTIQGDLVDAFIESGCGMGISYNQNFFFFRIDHILHSTNMTSINCTVDNSIKNSDHYPVWSYFTLN